MPFPGSKAYISSIAWRMGEIDYDADVRMPVAPFSSPGYHTTLTGGAVHSTRLAAEYALMLLDAGGEENAARARDVLGKLLTLQDTDPANATYGIWSWFYEEPLPMMSPPDWNWADFIGKDLYQALRYHAAELGADLAAKTEAALRHACLSIFRRNMHPGYTNISIMGAAVTLLAGELLSWRDMEDYGLSRLTKLHKYNMDAGGFAEYNSSTYTRVALQDLSMFHANVSHPEAKRMTCELMDLCWQVIAGHYHAPSAQWMGPMARAYSTLTKPETLATIAQGTGIELPCGGAADVSLLKYPARCPDALLPNFLGARERELVERVPGDPHRCTATTALSGRYALGSFSVMDTWNQRRNLHAAFGSVEKPGYMAVRVLRDGIDFSSGMICCAQKGGAAVFAQGFVTDGGNTHCNLDMIQGETILARDMRLRIELGGPALASVGTPVWRDGRVSIDLPGVRLDVCVAFARWDGSPCAMECARVGDVVCLDVVFFSREETRDVRLSGLAATGVAAAVCFDGTAQCRASVADGLLEACGGALRAAISVSPVKRAALVVDADA